MWTTEQVSNLKTPNKIAREMSKILLDHSNIEITWIKTRVGYKGNEVADSLAKHATENGIPCTNIQFPRCFIKEFLKSLMLEKWQNEWTGGVTGRDIYNLIPRVKMRMEPWRRKEVIFFTGHGPFPTYLYTFNLITSKYCSCGGMGSKLHYATEYPLTESWHLRKFASHLIHVWLRQVAVNSQEIKFTISLGLCLPTVSSPAQILKNQIRQPLFPTSFFHRIRYSLIKIKKEQDQDKKKKHQESLSSDTMDSSSDTMGSSTDTMDSSSDTMDFSTDRDSSSDTIDTSVII
ncbi:hypothetical protein AVEN_120882-1 [Araneus ventricosus]|uniref:Uncharacterized protein n=1 Tax=Araneus ventricosus TaxID=182803 RepID=A0A4Y2KTF8_ARAVE|nr:hypothetical protein AVEN_120882-1 [Araneus ventricosus]